MHLLIKDLPIESMFYLNFWTWISFEKMASLVKHDSSEIKGKLSAYPERDWNAAIVSLRGKKKEHDSEMTELESELVNLREKRAKSSSRIIWIF